MTIQITEEDYENYLNKTIIVIFKNCLQFQKRGWRFPLP